MERNCIIYLNKKKRTKNVEFDEHQKTPGKNDCDSVLKRDGVLV